MDERTHVFISYSHPDKKWLERLLTPPVVVVLAPLADRPRIFPAGHAE